MCHSGRMHVHIHLYFYAVDQRTAAGFHDLTADDCLCQLLGNNSDAALHSRLKRSSVTSWSHGGALHKMRWACLLLMSFAMCQELYSGL